MREPNVSGPGRRTWRDVMDGDTFTVAELLAWMRENGVPETAEIAYAGCGSHGLTLAWEVEQ